MRFEGGQAQSVGTSASAKVLEFINQLIDILIQALVDLHKDARARACTTPSNTEDMHSLFPLPYLDNHGKNMIAQQNG